MTIPDYAGRLSRLRQAFQEKNLDGVIVNSIKDVYYYTGKEISKEFGFLVVTMKSSTLFVSFLNISLEGPGVRVVSSLNEVRKELSSLKRVGFDEKNMSVLLFKKLKSGSWTPFSGILKSLRMVKDSYEISQIRLACRNTLRILGSLNIRGSTEFDVATDILMKTRSMGDTPAFDSLVLGGRNSAFIHKPPSKSMISRGLVIVDMGVCHNKYNSDITRTFSIDTTPAESRILSQCSDIQNELIELAVPGTLFSDIQKRFESLMKSMGHHVLYSFGHGVGLSVHERPFSKDVLEKGMVLTVEPGIHKKGMGGCRIEDMVLVGDKPVLLSR